MTASPKILISGGGTGGHIYPAVAIANSCKEVFPNAEILFVGALGKMEMEKVPKAGYKIVGLPIAGFNRSNMLANLGFPFKLIKSVWEARNVLKGFKPDIAVGVGGYASGPTLFVANLLGISTLLQEQNSFAGVTNKLLARKAKKICVAYPDMERFFPKAKLVFTGNPVRKDIVSTNLSKEEAKANFGLDAERKCILVIGGSQGARSINRAIKNDLAKFESAQVSVLWQTGPAFEEEALEAAKGYANVAVRPFIYEMDKAYAAADVVISRAGALSVSELCLTAKPAVLVPFPLAAEDHQTQNALSLVERNAAVLIKDAEAADQLADTALGLIDDEIRQMELSKNIRLFAKPNAANEIVEEIKKIVTK
ncbi:undecaprenyldiphospho-muramoylpentapeptide beta-N-acetylglucosaminyltransferase [Marinilongibacter aquaticus]|uniref:undecaprenyldiphospho-muramoylpentapeptide beta-N-acetylglucosaminyltransferase n=1 Tax=Marinilongibacter aquaticus TaxID=2975157 RepID=UPI0021BD4177|nr:undecaprenyldiphospho-muramoylpentapeptide beta-N-acetylglucosaminyltransferase [Marinilongibacter aquaticus]UBM57253.1 undecaprenyldiphospho-muramoylpentapeptide beta-N-acetylglucosaminyltransferase [Marinilongibacter aquaticus]